MAGMAVDPLLVMEEEQKAKSVPLFSFRSTRLWVCFLLTIGLSSTVSMRLDLSMAIVCMVNSTAVKEAAFNSSAEKTENYMDFNNQTVEDGCPVHNTADSMKSMGYSGHLVWTPQMQALLLSTTFYGGMITIFFSGYVADRFGPKIILIVAMIDYILVTFLSPTLAENSYEGFFVGRVLMGLGEGFVFPSGGSVQGRWFSANERSTIAAFFTSGNQIASSLTSLISANLCASSFGWPAIFYLFGSIGLIWIVAWSVIFTNSPEENRWISTEEKEFLSKNVRQPTKDAVQLPILWRRLATSGPLLVAVLCQFSYNFQAATFQAFLPTYFKEELRVPLYKNGIYTMIPFITQLISKIVLAIFADHLKKNQIISHNNCAKMFQAVSSIGCALTMLGLALLPNCNRVWVAAVLLGCFGFFFSCGIPGFFTSILSLDPRSSGLLTSIAMTFGMAGNICGPLLLSFLDGVAKDRKWFTLFLFNVVMNIIMGVLFFCFGSAVSQPWSVAKRLEKEQPVISSEKVVPSVEDIRKKPVSVSSRPSAFVRPAMQQAPPPMQRVAASPVKVYDTLM